MYKRQEVQDEKLLPIFMQIQKDFDETYDLHALYIKFHSFLKETMGHEERLQMLMKACVELISKETPKWEYIAARFLSYQLHQEINARMKQLQLTSFYEKIQYLSLSLIHISLSERLQVWHVLHNIVATFQFFDR